MGSSIRRHFPISYAPGRSPLTGTALSMPAYTKYGLGSIQLNADYSAPLGGKIDSFYLKGLDTYLNSRQPTGKCRPTNPEQMTNEVVYSIAVGPGIFRPVQRILPMSEFYKETIDHWQKKTLLANRISQTKFKAINQV